MSVYSDNTWNGVTQQWHNTHIIDSTRTHRGTHVEMVQHQKWGAACYMDQQIQSCEIDEYLYHESLVHPAMAAIYEPKRVMIIGGGEGATAREVLKWPTVEHVDMYEWDRDVVQLFQSKYPQWAKGAWENPALHIHYEDIFEVITKYPSKTYDVIIIDLFDPLESEKDKWVTLFHHLPYWKRLGGTIAVYAGIRSITQKVQPYQFIKEIIRESPIQLYGDTSKLEYYDVTVDPYHVYIPSFEGESMFLLIHYRYNPVMIDRAKTFSHFTKNIWKSYKVLNW